VSARRRPELDTDPTDAAVEILHAKRDEIREAGELGTARAFNMLGNAILYLAHPAPISEDARILADQLIARGINSGDRVALARILDNFRKR